VDKTKIQRHVPENLNSLSSCERGNEPLKV
jgi:hypothetical protein